MFETSRTARVLRVVALVSLIIESGLESVAGTVR